MLDLSSLKTIFRNEYDEILQDYFSFLRFPSISTDPSYKESVHSCASWLSAYLKKWGLKVETLKTSGAPVVFASDLRAGPDKKTVLIYCHYDVQPVDPLNLWSSPPFEPTLKGNRVYARGAADNKGQCFYTIRAIKTLLEHLPSLPINLKFLIEGEEECGSVGLAGILEEKKDLLKADYLLIVDAGLEKPGQPAISLGCRGIISMTVSFEGSRFDLHSGTHGGIVYNPNRALVEVLASLHDESGKVTIPHFYDHVKALTEKEASYFSLQFDEARFEKDFGAKATGIESGFSPLQSAWLRPTLEFNGISGGYAGPGFKTVIPARASAKISCRLVPDQNPREIAKMVEKEIVKRTPQGITVHIEHHPGIGRPFRTSPHSEVAKVMTKAYSEVFDRSCSHILLGGSIPIAADLAEASKSDMVLVGVGLSTDQIHAPDEHFDLERFEQGYLTIARALQLF